MKITKKNTHELAKTFTEIFQQQHIKITIKNLHQQILSLEDDFTIENITKTKLTVSIQLQVLGSRKDFDKYWYCPNLKITLTSTNLQRYGLTFIYPGAAAPRYNRMFSFHVNSNNGIQTPYTPYVQSYGINSYICLGDGTYPMRDALQRGDIQSMFLIIRSIVDKC